MTTIRKVLIPTKFEELSFLVVQQFLALQQAGLEEIVFLFVVERDEVSFDRFRGLDEEYAAKLTHEATVRFEDWESQIAGSGVKCSHRVELGNVPGKILQIAEEEGVDLIVTGRQRSGLLENVYLGGTAMALLRRAKVPVMVCKPDGQQLDLDEVPNVFERLLLATDFSSEAERARDVLMALDGACESLELVHVLNERDMSGHAESAVAQVRAEAQSRLDAMAPPFEKLGWGVRSHVLAGKTTVEILRARKDYDATMIVMGTTGKHGLGEMWLGSASHRVTELSPVPVLLVPAAE